MNHTINSQYDIIKHSQYWNSSPHNIFKVLHNGPRNKFSV